VSSVVPRFLCVRVQLTERVSIHHPASDHHPELPLDTAPHHYATRLAYQPLITVPLYIRQPPSQLPSHRSLFFYRPLYDPNAITTHDHPHYDFESITTYCSPTSNLSANPICLLRATVPDQTATSLASVAAPSHRQPCRTFSNEGPALAHRLLQTIADAVYPLQLSDCRAHSKPLHPRLIFEGEACRRTPTRTLLTRARLRKTMLRTALRPPQRHPLSDA
jgi:hypothetical protein